MIYIQELFQDLPDLILGHSIYIDVLQLLNLVPFYALLQRLFNSFCTMKP